MDRYLSELRLRLQARVAELEAAIQGLSTDFPRWSNEVRRISKQLRRAGGKYGFPEVTEAAGAAELAEVDRLAEAAVRLRDTLRAVGLAGNKRERVLLIVEDDPALVRTLEAALAAPDRRILSAGTVAQASELLAAHNVTLMVLDLFLPDDDGRRLLMQLIERPRGVVMPVFVMAGQVSAAVKAECLQLGAEAFFEKPVDPAALATAVAGRLALVVTTATPVLNPAEPPAPLPPTLSVVLLAEDDELVTSVVQHRLGREGFEVRAYPDGKAALDSAQHYQADLVILDDQLPVMDGFQLLERLRALPHYRDVPVIMLTSLGGQVEQARAFELGANDYLVKPFSPGELVTRVRRLVAG